MQTEDIGIVLRPLLLIVLVHEAQCVPKRRVEWSRATTCLACSSLEDRRWSPMFQRNILLPSSGYVYLMTLLIAEIIPIASNGKVLRMP
jgi:hypothetical protein